MSERAALGLLVVVGTIAAALQIPLCPFAMLTGIPCPGCGLARATLALVSGNWHAAFALHPLVGVAVPAAAVAALHVTRRRPASRPVEWSLTLGAGALVILFVGVWVARFHGAFGGPVAVRTIWDLATR